MSKQPVPLTSDPINKQVFGIIENIIAAQRAKTRHTGWTKADEVLASYTLWEVRFRHGGGEPEGWMVKCVASQPTAADFAPYVAKKVILNRLYTGPCPAAQIIERREKGGVNNRKASYVQHLQTKTVKHDV